MSKGVEGGVQEFLIENGIEDWEHHLEVGYIRASKTGTSKV